MDLTTIVATDNWNRLTALLAYGEVITDRSVEPCDLSQECFIGLHSASQRFEENRGASLLTFARSWMRQRIRRTARNTTIGVPTRFRDSFVDRSSFPSIESASETDDNDQRWGSSTSPEDEVIDRHSYLDLAERARRALTTEQYYVLMMTADGWSVAEIARELECSPRRVSSLLALARTKMQHMLTQDQDRAEDVSSS